MLLACASFLLLWGYGRRPSRSHVSVEFEEGARYERRMVGDALVHELRLRLERFEVVVSRPDLARARGPEGGHGFPARTVREFARSERVFAAINANFFHPFHSNAPWDFSPRAGETSWPIGDVISGGVSYGTVVTDADEPWPAACFDRTGVAFALRCPAGTVHAVAGQTWLVQEGAAVPHRSDAVAPRTALGVDGEGRVVLVVVDGRQPLYSPGLTLDALASHLATRNLVDAINLDGGGSSVLVVEGAVWSAPIHTRLPMRMRPVAVQLGFRAR